MYIFAKRNLVAAAVAVGLGISANAVAGDVSVYGKLHVSVASLSNDAGATQSDSIALSSHASRFGLKGSRDFGDLQGSFKVEYEIDASGENDKSSTKDILKARNIYVGLKGGFGEVRFGNHDTPHKISTGDLDVFSDTYADYNNVISRDSRLANTIFYQNAFNGIGLAVSYSGGDDSITGENKGQTSSFMVNYKTDMLYVSAANSYVSDAAGTDIENAPKFGLGVTMNGISAGVVYEVAQYANGTETTEWYVSMKAEMGGDNTVKAAYGTRDTAADPKFFAVGLDHKLDDKASVYALIANGSDGGLSSKGGLANDGLALVAGAVYNF